MRFAHLLTVHIYPAFIIDHSESQHDSAGRKILGRKFHVRAKNCRRVLGRWTRFCVDINPAPFRVGEGFGNLRATFGVWNGEHAPVVQDNLFINWIVEVNIRLMGTGVAISDPDDFSVSAGFKRDEIVSNGDDTAFCIGDCDCDDAKVFAVGIDRSTVGREFDGGGSTGRLDPYPLPLACSPCILGP